MLRMLAVARRLAWQFAHDPRLVVFIVVVPVVVLFILDTIFGSPTFKPLILESGLDRHFVRAMRTADAHVRSEDETKALADVAAGRADAFVHQQQNGRLQITVEGSDPGKTAAVLAAVREAMAIVARARPAPVLVLPGGNVLDTSLLRGPVLRSKVFYIYGTGSTKVFDYYGPVFIGYLTFFLVFLTSGISFLRERTGGTIDRLMASPIRRWEVVGGYVIGFGVLAFVQSSIIAWAGVYWLNLPMFGRFTDLLAVTLMLGLMALTFGLFVSEFADTELQVIQLIQLVVIPQIFLSGVFDLSTTPQWMQTVSNVLPLTYAARALRSIMIRGQTLYQARVDVFVLGGFTLAFLVADVLTLKKYRRA